MNIAAKDQNQRSHCAFPKTLGSGGGIFRDISLNRVLSWGENYNRRMIEIVFMRILNISCPSGEQLEACWFFSCPQRPSSPSSSARSCVAAAARSWIDKFKRILHKKNNFKHISFFWCRVSKKTKFYQIELLEILLPVGKKYLWYLWQIWKCSLR